MSEGATVGSGDAGDFGGSGDAGDFGGSGDAGDFGGSGDAGDSGEQKPPTHANPDLADHPPRQHPRWVLPAIVIGIAVLIAMNNIGHATWASLVNSHPLGLLALNSSNKFLLLTAAKQIDLLPWLAVPFVRLWLADPLFYLLGFLWRDRAVKWGRRLYPGSGQLFDMIDSEEGRLAASFLVVFASNNPVCLIAGATALPVGRFILLNTIGTLGRLALMRVLGGLFQDEITSFLDTVARYQKWVTIGSIALVLCYFVLRRTKGVDEVGTLTHLDDE